METSAGGVVQREIVDLGNYAGVFYDVERIGDQVWLGGTNGLLSTVITDAAGQATAVYNPGLFEGAVFPMDGPELVVQAYDGVYLVDTLSGASHQALVGPLQTLNGYSSHVFTLSAPTTERYCSSSPNSTGRAARAFLLGSADVGVQALDFVATGMPDGEFCLGFFGTDRYDVPFGNGRLCVSPFAPGIVRSPIARVRPGGIADVAYDFQTPGLGSEFSVGTSWSFQMMFRDTAVGGFDTTDAVRVTF